MGTAEIIIVFSALMALIALVTIGIDWIAKPLKNRRFIPRMYRFEDEKLPLDAYGHTDFTVPEAEFPSQPTMVPYMQPAPVVVAHVPQAPVYGSPDTVAVPATGRSADIAEPAIASGTGSAFSDSLAGSAATEDAAPATSPETSSTEDIDDWLATGLVPTEATIPTSNPSGTGASSSRTRSGIASTVSVPSMGAWSPGMALDETINDRKPNLATKAQRFWMSTAATLGDSHFDDDNLARMRAGKAPQRRNPRTSRTETMQLTGLRQASQPEDARMQWLEEAIDPWNAS